MMAIDGTWRRECVVNDLAGSAATLTVSASIGGLNSKEFSLLLFLKRVDRCALGGAMAIASEVRSFATRAEADRSA